MNNLGSYSKDDVEFLLKDISDLIIEQDDLTRESVIQNGGHYSDMLPIEYTPSEEYMDLFYESLEQTSEKLAIAIGVLSERILASRGQNIVLVSLARAGTPVGILVKRYIKHKYHLDLPHYSISIIRGKGIDENALDYIVSNHPSMSMQFIDGWTGKGAIKETLVKSLDEYYGKSGIKLNSTLAVLADPAWCSEYYGIREDFLIPSACLNSTVSGLLSRTVHRKDLIGENDFHGVKYYKELKDDDVSNLFIDTITNFFSKVEDGILNNMVEKEMINTINPSKHDLDLIQETYGIEDINFIKPGIGETTRVLLRRIPYRIIVSDMNDKKLEHIILIAKEKQIQIDVLPLRSYRCCGIIKNLKDT